MKKSLSLALLFSTLLISTQYVQAKNTYSLNRLYGNNRYQTSANIANNFNKDKIQNIIIASGDNFPDGLSGSVLSKKLNAPIVLVDKNINNNTDSLNYIKNHLDKTGTVYILGGTGSVTADYEAYIMSLGFTNIKRLGGVDRFDTNNIIVNNLKVKKGTPIIITNGYGFADELSISGIAASNGYPIFMTSSDKLPNSVTSQIISIQPSKIYIIGGTGAVSDDIKSQIKTALPSINDTNIIRIGGQNRYETSLNICKYFKPSSDTAILANGENFPDALSGTALAGKSGAPIILTNGTDIANQKNYLDNSNYKNLILLGGTGAVSQNIEDILNNKSTSDTPPTPTIPSTDTDYMDIGTISNPTPDQVLSFIKKYSPESYDILNKEIILSKNKDIFKEYIKNSLGVSDELNTIVHEITHGYIEDTGALYRNNNKINSCCLNFYISDTQDIPVTVTNIFKTNEIASSIPSNLRTYRFNTYINSSNGFLGAQIDGVYGLLNEFDAYYLGTKASYDLYDYYLLSEQTSKNWNDYIYGIGYYSSYAEFKFYILKYLIYAKENHPDVYQGIINNINFKLAFNSLDDKFFKLTKDCIKREQEITNTKIKDTTNINYYKKDYDLLMNEMNKEEYQQMLSVLKN